MPTLNVTLRDGSHRSVDGSSGNSAMHILRDNGIDEIMALCGGCLSCATCHVYVDDAVLDKLAPIGEVEDELLESSDHRTANSRLSCQIIVDDRLDGMSLTIAPED
jgi:2Fe-2S ferredoxin